MRHPLLDILAKAASGLLFISESEAELEPVLWENIPDPGEKRLRALIDIDADTPIETMGLPNFFRAVSKIHKPEFDKLASVLQAHLADIKVYKIGEVQMDVYILGRTKDGHWAGLKTAVVET